MSGIAGGIILAYIFYLLVRALFRFRLKTFVRRRWAERWLIVAALGIIGTTHLLFPPGEDVEVKPHLSLAMLEKPDAPGRPSWNKPEADQNVAAWQVAVKDDLISEELQSVFLSKQLKELEIWSLSKAYKLDVKAPSRGLWGYVEMVPSLYSGRTRDDVFGKTKLSCRIQLWTPGVRKGRLCDLAVSLDLAADVFRGDKEVVRLRFPALRVQLNKASVVLKVGVRNKRQAYSSRGVLYELQIGNSWKHLPVRLSLAEFSKLAQSDVHLRMRPLNNDLAFHTEFSTREQFDGLAAVGLRKPAKEMLIDTVIRVERIKPFVQLSRDFVLGAYTQYRTVWPGKLDSELIRYFKDSLYSAGGYDTCPELYRSQALKYAMADLGGSLSRVKEPPAYSKLLADVQYRGLGVLSSLKGAACNERQIALEIAASHVAVGYLERLKKAQKRLRHRLKQPQLLKLLKKYKELEAEKQDR